MQGRDLKQKLRSGEVVYASSVRLAEPVLGEILGLAGFDFVVLDGEHGVAEAATLEQLILGCLAGGTAPIARVLRSDDPTAVMRALDLGAHGILLPHCRTSADARRLRDAALYPPDGTRGFGPGRGTAWGRTSTDEYLRTADDSVVLIGIVEDPEGIENIDQIAAAGLDCLWFGSGDLAMAYGLPGERGHPRVIAAALELLDACRRHGVVAGYPVGDAQEAEWAVAQGFRAIGYGGAEQYVMQTARQFLARLGR
jgi:staphyloferrin B biosynthesis citrate synthase